MGGNGSIFLLAVEGGAIAMSKLIPGQKRAVRALAFHPRNPNWLVSAGVDGIFLHDVERALALVAISQRPVRELAVDLAVTTIVSDGAHEGEVECLAWAEDGACLLSGGKDAAVRVWDTSGAPATWRLLETITGHKAAVLAIEYCPAVRKFATAGRDASIKVFDAASLALDWRARRAEDSAIVCSLLGTCESHGDVVCLCWAPDGSHLLSGSRDNAIRVWSVTTFVEIREVSDKRQGMRGKHRSDVRHLAYLPAVPGTAVAAAAASGRRFLLSASLDGTFRLWRIEPIVEEETAAASLLAAAAAGGGGRAGAGAGAGAGGADAPLLDVGDGPSSSASAAVGDVSIAMGGDASGAGGGWDQATAALLREIMGAGFGGGTGGAVGGLASPAPGGSSSSAAAAAAAAASAAAAAKGIHAGIDTCLATMPFFDTEAYGAADDGIAGFALNPARPILAYSSSAHAFALGNLNFEAIGTVEAQHDGRIKPGSAAAAAMGGMGGMPGMPGFRAPEIITQVKGFHGHTGTVHSVALLGSDDRSLASAGADCTLAVFDTGAVERRLVIPFGTSVHALALGPPLAAGGAPMVYAGGADYTIRAYSSNPADYAPIRAAYAGKPSGPEPVPAHDYEAVRYVGHSGRVSCISIDGSGKIMASCGHDWSVLLWNLDKPAPLLSVSQPSLLARCSGTVLPDVCPCAFRRGSPPIIPPLRSLLALFHRASPASSTLPLPLACLTQLPPPPHLQRSPRPESSIPTAAPMAKVDVHDGHVPAVAFSSLEAGSLLATGGSDHSVKVWRVTSGLTGTGLANVWASGPKAAGGHTSAVSCLAWGRGDAEAQRLLLSGSWDCTIRVWAGTRPNKLGASAARAAAEAVAGSAAPMDDVPSANDVAPLRVLSGHTSRITDVQVAPAGDVFVSTAADGTARVWRMREPFACIASCVLSHGDGIPSSVAVGTHIFATGCDTGVLVWPLRPQGPFGAYFTSPAAAAGGELANEAFSAGAGAGAGSSGAIGLRGSSKGDPSGADGPTSPLVSAGVGGFASASSFSGMPAGAGAGGAGFPSGSTSVSTPSGLIVVNPASSRMMAGGGGGSGLTATGSAVELASISREGSLAAAAGPGLLMAAAGAGGGEKLRPAAGSQVDLDESHPSSAPLLGHR